MTDLEIGHVGPTFGRFLTSKNGTCLQDITTVEQMCVAIKEPSPSNDGSSGDPKRRLNDFLKDLFDSLIKFDTVTFGLLFDNCLYLLFTSLFSVKCCSKYSSKHQRTQKCVQIETLQLTKISRFKFKQ